MMPNVDTCRVCLADGAVHQIFENINSEGSIHFKLFLCFHEKIEDLIGYPRKICESCKNIIDTVHEFIATYKASSKQLERAIILVKKELFESETEIDLKDEISIGKKETHCEGQDPLNDVWATIPQKETLNEEQLKKEPSDESYSDVDTGVVSSIVEDKIKSNDRSLSRNKTRKRKPENKHIDGDPSTPQNDLSDTGSGECINTEYKLPQQNNRQSIKIPEKCPMCPQVLSSKYYLDCHVKRVHGEENSIDHLSYVKRKLKISSDGGVRKRQDNDGGADFSDDGTSQNEIDEIIKKKKVQNKIRCQRYRDRKKKETNAIASSQMYIHRTITVEEEAIIKRRKEYNKQKSKRYRDKKRATNLINLQKGQSSKTVVPHVSECQNFHNTHISDPSTVKVPYEPPDHTTDLSTRNDTYIPNSHSDYDDDIRNDTLLQVFYVPQLHEPL